MTVAHDLAAAGAPAGTLVLAEEQTAGRGREGRAWASERGTGVWMTLVERPIDPTALEVLSLRIGLRAARVLDRFASQRVSLKWPNDLYIASGKLGGVLIECRWRGKAVDWVAIGLGVNVTPPRDVPWAAALLAGTDRLELLGEIVPAVRAASTARGPLTGAELEGFAARDLARGRRCTAPAVGVVKGIDAGGALLVQVNGATEARRSGSLVLTEERER